MPRGEHFKKENPRINQVSFKVNDTELKMLQELATKDGVSVAVWLRNRINLADSDTAKVDTPVDIPAPAENINPESPVEKEEVVEEKKVVTKPKVEKVIKKSKDYDKGTSSNEQMSLF